MDTMERKVGEIGKFILWKKAEDANMKIIIYNSRKNSQNHGKKL